MKGMGKVGGDLLSRAQAGGRGAVTTILELHLGRIRRFVARMALDPAAADGKGTRERMLRGLLVLGIGLSLLASCATRSSTELSGSPDGAAVGRFVRTWWSPSRREGSPVTSNRVNTRVIPVQFKDRPEVQATNCVTIRMDEDPSHLESAELYLELWGGHPGTARKRFTVNGQGSYELPEVGTAEGHCTFSYPLVPLDRAHLRRGDNVFEFSCEQGTSFWGHFLFEVAAVRAVLRRDHPDLRATGWEGFRVRVQAEPRTGEPEFLKLSVQGPPEDLDRIDFVDFQGFYFGYDENGDGKTRDWHGFTKQKAPAGILGSSQGAPFQTSWDLTMVPDQKGMAVRALVHLRRPSGLVYETVPLEGLSTPPRDPSGVVLHASRDLPCPFWSRASRLRTCTIEIPENLCDLDRAELHVVIWDGGRGQTPAPFTLNHHELPVTGQGKHDVLYRVLPIDPNWLRKGPNVIEVLSDTEHHGIEVLLPGPAIVVRGRTGETNHR
jgi:hypothetical protein